jgi:hypothetical protein
MKDTSYTGKHVSVGMFHQDHAEWHGCTTQKQGWVVWAGSTSGKIGFFEDAEAACALFERAVAIVPEIGGRYAVGDFFHGRMTADEYLQNRLAGRTPQVTEWRDHVGAPEGALFIQEVGGGLASH